MRGRGLRIKVSAPGKTAEADVQRDALTVLIANGWMPVRFNSGAVRMPGGRFVRFYRIPQMDDASDGFPDVAAWKGERYLLIEVKDETGKLRPSQVRFAELARQHGVTVNVCRDWLEVLAIVREVVLGAK